MCLHLQGEGGVTCWIFICTKCGRRYDFGVDHPYPCDACGEQTWAEKGWMKKQGLLVLREEREISEKIHILDAPKSKGGKRTTTDEPTVKCSTCVHYEQCKKIVHKHKMAWPRNCRMKEHDKSTLVINDERLLQV